MDRKQEQGKEGGPDKSQSQPSVTLFFFFFFHLGTPLIAYEPGHGSTCLSVVLTLGRLRQKRIMSGTSGKARSCLSKPHLPFSSTFNFKCFSTPWRSNDLFIGVA